MALHALHLCSGYGGFELALRGIARTVCHVERDAYAAATLVARMAEARLDQAPIWDDLTTFDGHPWRGRVDLITAGFPCQPFSAAGKRMGLDDDRWLWPDIERIIREVRPRYVFLENVPGVVRAGLPAVLHSLAQLGFDAEWGLYAASDVGAPHRRQRFWLVAHADGIGRDTIQRSPIGGAQRGIVAPASSGEDVGDAAGSEPAPFVGAGDGWADVDGAGGGTRRLSNVGHASGSGRSEVTGSAHGDEAPHGSQHGHVAHSAGEDVADPAGARRKGSAGERRLQPVELGSHRFPPRPDDHDGWAEWDGAQPSIRRGTDGATEWLADALHLGGNGLVPQCAREAWLQLVERFA